MTPEDVEWLSDVIVLGALLGQLPFGDRQRARDAVIAEGRTDLPPRWRIGA